MQVHSTAMGIESLERSGDAGREGSRGVLRGVVRSLGFMFVLILAALDYARVRVCGRDRAVLQRKARWLQRWSRVVIRVIGLELQRRGDPPSSGMIVSNHLSYLDILAYSALVPCVFVAKKEVASWPVLGVFARLAGSIFVDRTRRTKVAETNQSIATALQSGVVVLLFPEGTSSDGETVLPFRSSHLEPAIRSGATMRPAAIHYRMDGGSAAREACYWGDMTFLPHLLNLFTKRKTHACVAFGQEVVKAAGRGRKQNGLDLHKHVCTLTELLRP